MFHRLKRLDPDRYAQFTGQYGCIRAAASHVTWNNIAGDYLEFGVWQGDGIAEAYHAMNYYRQARDSILGAAAGSQQRRLFAFDSFSGLPASDGPVHEDYAQGSYFCSEPQFWKNLQNKGVPRDHAITVSGYFDVSLNNQVKARHNLRQAAVVLIDCDLYESTVPVLEFLSDLLVQGSILIFDDWFRFAGSRHHGERRACNEWLAARPEFELEDWWQEGPQCKAFLVHRR